MSHSHEDDSHSHEDHLHPKLKDPVPQQNFAFRPTFVANPHALLIDGVVTEVVFMQDYSEEQIAEKLKSYRYDEVVRNEDYGWHLVCGYIRDKQDPRFIGPKRPFPSWVPNFVTNQWNPPVPMPSCDGRLKTWNEEAQTWDNIEGAPTHEIVAACASCSSK